MQALDLIAGSDAARSLGRTPGYESTATIGGQITFFGGFCLLFNNACGAGVAAIPYVFVSSGWVVATVTLLFFWLMSSLVSTLLCEAMTIAPPHEQEITGSAKLFLGNRGQTITQIFLFFALASQQIASIIISAQSLDMGLVDIFGNSCAIGYFSHHPLVPFGCSHHRANNSPFRDTDVVASFGFLLAALFAIPFGMWDLESNIIVQIACMWLTFACIFYWLFDIFSWDQEFQPLEAVGLDFSQLFGTMLFNFAYVVTVPSWCIKRSTGVSVNRSVWMASTFCFVTYLVVGWVGASALRDELSVSTDLLTGLNRHGLARPADVFFPIMAALSGVPIFAIIIRDNLLESGACGKTMATFLSTGVPWTVALIFQTGDGLQNVINLTSLFFSSVINFIIPLACVYVYARKHASAVRTGGHAALPCAGRRARLILTSVTIGMGFITLFSIICAISQLF